DQRELRHPPRQLDNGPMRRIGLRLQHLHAPPLVPAPDQRRITAKRLGRGQLGWIEALPQPAQCIAKRGNVAFRRNAGTGEDHYVACRLKRCQGFDWEGENIVWVHRVSPPCRDGLSFQKPNPIPSMPVLLPESFQTERWGDSSMLDTLYRNVALDDVCCCRYRRRDYRPGVNAGICWSSLA